ncbi:hypothetical protein C456_03341 [Haloferax volcanii DSM 14919]|uniref:Uncharacterized protein n=1 Tax=Haloferax lucentense (strain DSM 14919 / JCM 9276 / NCIMB 13854 / Aa 2.2) TaxID=1230452 RepID=M0H0R2_HALL2|nr:hypothetical protein C456_03341 [Haloferax lucentense DSM 14919]
MVCKKLFCDPFSLPFVNFAPQLYFPLVESLFPLIVTFLLKSFLNNTNSLVYDFNHFLSLLSFCHLKQNSALNRI